MRVIVVFALIIITYFIVQRVAQKAFAPPFVCPETDWVNCMPTVPKDRQYQCDEAYLKQALANCPGFQGAAY